MNKQTFLIFLFFANISLSFANVFYVAPNGNDANTGTIDQPLESIYKAQELVSPGDTVYIRGGQYNMRPEQISNYYSIWAYVTKLDKSGTSTAPIN